MTSATAWRGRKTAVVGLGRAGVAAATALLDLGAEVLVVDETTDDRRDQAADLLATAGADVRRGVSRIPARVDLVVTSPGLRHGHPMLEAAAAEGAEVIGEPELAWRLQPRSAASWLGVTGTNGKTTTVEMLAAILAADGRRSVAAGNVGLPLVDAVRTDPPYDVLAVEMSSAQLTLAPSVRFAVGAILNIAPDHLDWHGSWEAYRAAKLLIWRDAIAVGNADDPEVASALPAGGVAFGRDLVPPAFTLIGDALYDADGAELIAAGELAVRGPHNLSNALAAAAVARSWGSSVAAVRSGLRGFRAGPHRAALVAAAGGVTWIDDSKATNPHAASASLLAHESVVWIAGGLLKGADVDDLVARIASRLRAVVLIGRDRDLIAQALARHAPGIPVEHLADTDTGVMQRAVDRASDLARPGDAVLLAPAAASWDIFSDYAERGDLFAAAARAAADRSAAGRS